MREGLSEIRHRKQSIKAWIPNSALKELFEKVLAQKRNSKNKIYSLHETQVACIAKGKTHKPYEFGSKISIAMIPGSNVIVGVSHFLGNPHDSTTLQPTLQAINKLPEGIKYAITDRGYRGNKKIGSIDVILPNPIADHNKPIAYQEQKSSQCKTIKWQENGGSYRIQEKTGLGQIYHKNLRWDVP